MSRRSRVLPATILALLLLLLASAELFTLAQVNEPEKLSSRPGLIARFTAGEHQDARIDRLVALRVPPNSSPTPFIPPGQFTVTWQGELNLRLRDRMTFAADGSGQFQLEINGEIVLNLEGEDFSDSEKSEPVRLNKGANAFIARYTAPASGEAFLRLYTVKDDGTRDPVLPTMFTHDPADAPLAHAMQLRHGRELVAAQRCLLCHTAKDVRDHPSSGIALG